MKTYETQEKPKRAFLVSVVKGDPSDEPFANELCGLCQTLELDIIYHTKIRIREKSSKYIAGTGKAQEISEKAKELKTDLIVLDLNPSPSQQRSWEELCGIPVLDRQEIIIRIFAQRATTREAELQVRLAQLNYNLPRLTHKYIDLSRQRGGRYGTKGSGETKFETDRRKVEKRISQLEKEIEQVSKQRQMQRRQRERQGVHTCAIVGYTNSGKSSLLNALTGANVLAENKLFATLDAITRRFEPAPGKQVLLTDTVGFIRDLPHTLIKAFRSTLEEAALANTLIVVLDASDPNIESQYETTLSVLRELGAGEIPVITILNKIDKIPKNDEDLQDSLKNRFPGSIAMSVKDRIGLDFLKNKIVSML